MLDRHGLTASSRTMLVVYPWFYLAIGLAYRLGDPSRTSNHTFDYVRSLMPISHWGLVFLAVAVATGLAWLAADRRYMILALALGFGLSLAWTCGFAVSVFDLSGTNPSIFTPEASISGVAVWVFITIGHIASLRSLSQDHL